MAVSDPVMRLLMLGARMASLPEPRNQEGFELYKKLAGGMSYDDSAHALTEEEICELEAYCERVEREHGLGPC